jgi:hypothetical protein
MAIDIALSLPRSTQTEFACDPIVLLDSGVYWYLYPAFDRLAKESGQMIDLYDDARFRDKDLETLARTLQLISNELPGQPEEWDQVTGEQTYPVRRVLTDRVGKQDVAALIDRLQHMVTNAIKGRGVIDFRGD